MYTSGGSRGVTLQVVNSDQIRNIIKKSLIIEVAMDRLKRVSCRFIIGLRVERVNAYPVCLVNGLN